MKAQSYFTPGPDGWLLTPVGAIVHKDERTAVIADVHLGYEWARGRGGDVIPAHSLQETITRLTPLVSSGRVDRLIVAGDLVESPLPCRRTERDVSAIECWLREREIRLVKVAGNHDGHNPSGSMLTVSVADWTVSHGHIVVNAKKQITGHEHPILCLGSTKARCFLAGPARMILPAFSTNAAGRNVATSEIPTHWKGKSLECWAATDHQLLNFGSIETLHGRLARAASPDPQATQRQSSNCNSVPTPAGRFHPNARKLRRP